LLGWINLVVAACLVVQVSKWLLKSLGPLEIFKKFAEIFAAQGAPQMSTTLMANGKNLQTEKF
jgi:hypothetical protein